MPAFFILLILGIVVLFIFVPILWYWDRLRLKFPVQVLLSMHKSRWILMLSDVIFYFTLIFALFMHHLEERTSDSLSGFIMISILLLCVSSVSIFYFYQYYQIERDRKITLDKSKRLIEIKRGKNIYIFSFDEIEFVDLYQAHHGDRSFWSYYSIAILNTKSKEKIAITSLTIGEFRLANIMNSLFLVNEIRKQWRFLSEDELELLKRF